MMNWAELYFGPLNKQLTLRVVRDANWQKVRLSMKGTSLQHKYATLKLYLSTQRALGEAHYDIAKIQVTNYVTALSRGGLIKPSDYLTK